MTNPPMVRLARAAVALTALAVLALPLASADHSCDASQSVGFCTFGVCGGAKLPTPALLLDLHVIHPVGSTVVIACV